MTRYDPTDSVCTLCKGTGFMTLRRLANPGGKFESAEMVTAPCILGCTPNPDNDDYSVVVETIPAKDFYLT